MGVQKPRPRADERRLMNCAVQVSWTTSSGETRTLRAKCLDVSRQGARLECEQPIDLRTNVYLQAPIQGLMGNATVRYCTRAGLKYRIGLLFGSAASQAELGRKRCLSQSQAATEGPAA